MCIVFCTLAAPGSAPAEGFDWTRCDAGVTCRLEDVKFGGGIFVAAGEGGCVLTSADGVHWTRGQGAPECLSGLAFGSGLWVATSWSGNIYRSFDAVSWAEGYKGGEWLAGAAYGNGTFVAGGQTLLTSADGVQWVNRTPGADYNFYSQGVAWANGVFVAAGDEILLSPDGVRWESVFQEEYIHLSAVAYGAGTFVAVGWEKRGDYPGVVFNSADGRAWVRAPLPSGVGELYDVAFGNGLFVAVGKDGKIVASTDGRRWTLVASGSSALLAAVTFGNDRFVAVGEEGTILASELFPSLPGFSVLETQPGNGATVYAIEEIRVVLSRDAQLGSAQDKMALVGSDGQTVEVEKSLSGCVLVLKPEVPLSRGVTYTVTIPAGALQDLDGNLLAQDYRFLFTVGIPAGSLVSSFGNNGVVLGEGAKILDMAIDRSYMYLVGTDSTRDRWRIEKRYLRDGSLVPSFGDNGVITTQRSAWGNAEATGVALDEEYLYVVGHSKGYPDPYGYLEKRRLSDGSLVWSQGGTMGVRYYDVAVDRSYAYLVGARYRYSGEKFLGTSAVIEKRTLSNGSLVRSFGENGRVEFERWSGYQPVNVLSGIAIDGSSMFVVGRTGPAESFTNGFLSKRSLETGAPDPGFGFNGCKDHMSEMLAVAVDRDFVYAAGWDNLGSGDYVWVIDKFHKSNGKWASDFGPGAAYFAGGSVTSNPSPRYDVAQVMVLDGAYIYVAGYDCDTPKGDHQWRIEKRNLSDGSLVESFGEGGSVTVNPRDGEADAVLAMAADSEHLYVAGSWWRIEKRTKEPPSAGMVLVVSTDPADGATNVEVGKVITVTFSVDIQAGPTYGSIALRDASGNTVAMTRTIAGSVLTLKPDTNLAPGTTYTVFIPAGAVQDLAGNPLAQAYTFSFTTAAARKKGDVNGDGQINVLDVVRTVNIALGRVQPTEEERYAADANGDGVINVLDVVRIVNIALGRA